MGKNDVLNLTLDLLEGQRDLPLEFQLRELENFEINCAKQLSQNDLVPRVRRELVCRRSAAREAINAIPKLRKVIGKSTIN